MPRTLNPSVAGSSPARPTSEIKGLGPLGTEYVPTGVDFGVGTVRSTTTQLPGFSRISVGSLVPSGANDPRQLDLFPEIRHPGL